MADKVPALLDAIQLVNQAIALANIPKTNVPSDDQSRALE